MTPLLQIFPLQHMTSLEAVAAAALGATRTPIGVASSEAVNFCHELAHHLVSDSRARAFPSLQALGFWLRPAALTEILEQDLAAPEKTVRAPRGIVFQIPANDIDVLFAYAAALSLLAGNVTLVRLPSELRPEQELLIELFRETLERCHKAVKDRLLFLRYGHEDATTSALSALCDARMIWGSDETVRHLRTLPLPPLAAEVAFADRFSAAALNAPHYLALTEPQRDQLAAAAFNDIYLFDQRACASPRLVIWIGEDDKAEAAAKDFYPRLAALAAKAYHLPEASAELSKLNAHYLSSPDLSALTPQTYNAALTVLTLKSWDGLAACKKLDFGCGLLIGAKLDKLRDLAPLTERQDQTLAVWGFGPDEIHAFVTLCGGRGFDRIVPLGQALALDPIWDGNNLFDTLTRLVQIST